MTPRMFRARARVSLEDMASRLQLPLDDLRTLEATPLPLWDVAALGSYAEALGFRLRVLFVDADSKAHEVDAMTLHASSFTPGELELCVKVGLLHEVSPGVYELTARARILLGERPQRPKLEPFRAWFTRIGLLTKERRQ